MRILAGEPGFEPRLTESESAVLPLNYSPAGVAYCPSTEPAIACRRGATHKQCHARMQAWNRLRFDGIETRAHPPCGRGVFCPKPTSTFWHASQEVGAMKDGIGACGCLRLPRPPPLRRPAAAKRRRKLWKARSRVRNCRRNDRGSRGIPVRNGVENPHAGTPRIALKGDKIAPLDKFQYFCR